MPNAPRARWLAPRARWLRSLEQRFLFDASALIDPIDSDPRESLSALAVETLPNTEPRSVVFVVDNLPKLASLAQSLPSDATVVLLDAKGDGVAQITDWLQGRTGIESVHILSHGQPGEVDLGSVTLSNETLASYSAALSSWSLAFAPNADILLYGCDVAQADGSALIARLAQITGANIAASDDLTGDSGKGGDWELEAVSGAVQADTLTVAGYAEVFAKPGGTSNQPPAIDKGMSKLSGSVTEDGTLTVSGSITASDRDTGDTLTYSALGAGDKKYSATATGDYGTLSLNTSGDWTYALGNGLAAVQALGASDTVQDTFTIQVADGNGGTDTATVTIDIAGANDAPIAVDDLASIQNDATKAVTGNVLTNDSDVDGDTLSVIEFSGGGQYGTLDLKSDGTYSYVIDSKNYDVQALTKGGVLEETYTYKVSDGDLGRDAVLTITITSKGTNSFPVAVDDTVEIGEDATTPVTGNVLTNDSDVDLDTLSVSGFSGGDQYGTLNLNSDGTYSYVIKNDAVQALAEGSTLTETYTYTVVDGNGGFGTADLKITINGANDAPVIDESESVLAGSVTEDTEDGTLTVSGSITASDPDTGDTLTYSALGAGDKKYSATATGTYGTLTLASGSGQWTYELNNRLAAVQALGASDTEQDTFTIQVADGNGGFGTADLKITINGANDAPEISIGRGTNQSGSFDLGGTRAATGTITFTDVDSGDSHEVDDIVDEKFGTLSFGAVDEAKGTVQWSYSGEGAALEYLAEGVSDSATFSVTVSDGTGSDEIGITITVTGVNDAPVIDESESVLAGSVTEDGTLTVSGSITASDPDTGDTLTYSARVAADQEYSATATGTYGTLTLASGSGQWTYALNNSLAAVQALGAGQSVTDTFTVQVDDGNNGTATRDVAISVTGANEPPPPPEDPPPEDPPTVVTPPVVTAPVVTAPVVTAPVVTAPVVTAPVETPPVVTPPVETPPVVTAPSVPIVAPPAFSDMASGQNVSSSTANSLGSSNSASSSVASLALSLGGGSFGGALGGTLGGALGSSLGGSMASSLGDASNAVSSGSSLGLSSSGTYGAATTSSSPALMSSSSTALSTSNSSSISNSATAASAGQNIAKDVSSGVGQGNATSSANQTGAPSGQAATAPTGEGGGAPAGQGGGTPTGEGGGTSAPRGDLQGFPADFRAQTATFKRTFSEQIEMARSAFRIAA